MDTMSGEPEVQGKIDSSPLENRDAHAGRLQTDSG